jgi:broad specificity phosphatase PhoE
MNKEHLISGSIDDPLNETGIFQAREAAEKLRKKGEVFTFIISSPLSRALETAKIISEALKIDLYTDPRLRERCVGDYENQPEFPDMLKEFLKSEMPAINAEPLSSFRARILEILDEVSSSPQSVLLITHALPLLVILEKTKEWNLEKISGFKIPAHCVPMKIYFGDNCSNCGSKFYELKSE